MNISFNRKRRDPAREGQMQVKYAPGKRQLSNLKWRCTLFIVLSPCLYLIGKILFSIFVAPSSGFIVLGIQKYHTPVDGTVEAISIEVGQQIDTGKLLVTLKNDTLDSKIDFLERKVIEINKKSPEMKSLTHDFLLKSKRIAEADFQFHKKKFKDIDFLFRQGAATLAEHNSAYHQLNLSKSRLNSADYNYRQWRRNQIIESEESLAEKELRTEIDHIVKTKGELSIRSMYPGIVTEISVTQGQIMQKGDPVAGVARQDKINVAAFISPKYADRIRMGETAKIKFPSGRTVRGIVQHRPSITGRLPSYFISSMVGRQRMIVVYLNPLEKISESDRVDGLPVEVYFSSSTQRVMDRIVNFF